jgi:anti-sigma factor RsiW
MNCELAHERIALAEYGELPDEQIHELERHLTTCAACVSEREELMALREGAALLPVMAPDANLIARARLRLEEALDALPPQRWYERLGQRMMNNFASLQAAPVATALLLIVGGGAGVLGGYEFAEGRAAHVAATTPQIVAVAQEQNPAVAQAAQPKVVAAQVAGISSVVHQPNSNIVEVKYNQLVPRQVRGSMDDPQIRQLLMLASANAPSPGVRNDSVDLLAAECRAGRDCQAAGVRDALMVALRYDRNKGVREKALKGLEPFVAEDMRVRDAVLEALLNDDDPQIRSQAISMLEPVEADTSVRQVLYSVSTTDQNPHIRNVSRQVLSRVPEIQ